MPAVYLNVRLSDQALTMLDRLRQQKKGPNGEETSRERYLFTALREAGGSWTQRWNLLRAHGSVAIDPTGQMTIPATAVPNLPIGEGSPNANVRVLMPDLVLERVKRAAEMNAGVRVHAGVPNPWPTVVAWCEAFLTDYVAIHVSALEDEREKGAVDLFDKHRRVEVERARRRAALDSQESGGGESEAPSESLPAPSSAPVAVLEAPSPDDSSEDEESSDSG